jgi:hypothetical protein
VGSIALLAFGACFFPTLLACVAIIISRPGPRALLIAFYAGGVLTSVSTGIAVLAVFDNGGALLGSTRSSPHPTTSIAVGVAALLGAWLMASTNGNAMLAQAEARKHRSDLVRREPIQSTPSICDDAAGVAMSSRSGDVSDPPAA